MTTLSTHILDISTGKPAEGVSVLLQREGHTLARGVTNAQGRIVNLLTEPLTPGGYQLVAELGDWFAARGDSTLFYRAQIDFRLNENADAHYHLPFIIAPGGWSTYRGS